MYKILQYFVATKCIIIVIMTRGTRISQFIQYLHDANDEFKSEFIAVMNKTQLIQFK